MAAEARSARSRDSESAATRRAILDAAEALLATVGEEGLSIREVCARSGVTAPTVYHHFGDKAALVERVVDECFADFDRAFAGRAAPSDPVEALRWSFDRYVEYGLRHPAHYRLMFQPRRARLTPGGHASYEGLRRRVATIAAAGRLVPSVEDAAAAFWAAAHGVTALLVSGFLPPDAPMVALMREAMIAELTTPASAHRAGAHGTQRRKTPMTARESDTNPFLQGNFAPWRLEGSADDLEVIGAIPRDLNGTFYRNGPNPAYEPRGRYHWFDGDGMIHAVALRDGRAAYRNRWVLSDGLKEERAAGAALYPGLLEFSPSEAPRFKVTANTNIVFHAGRLLALVESAPPTQMAPGTLATVGLYDFGGMLNGPMTAHPKVDPETGEMLFFGYSPAPPYLQYHVADRGGALVRSEVIDVAWPSMIHDFAITADYVIFILCPLVFSFENLATTGKLFSWEPERGTRIGVMPRSGGNADVRWYETDPGYVFHPMNAYAEGDAIVLDVSRYNSLRFMDPAAWDELAIGDDDAARLHRWRIDLRPGGGIASMPLDDTSGEFPRVDERRVGRKHRFGYLAATGPEDRGTIPVWSTIKKYDLERGTSVQRSIGAGNGVGEPLFVPRHPGAAEDDGYVLVLVYDHARNGSDFYILDARDIGGEPIAQVRIPNRVPYGFHGNWVPA